MRSTRKENWGQVIYDASRDEFLAEIASLAERAQIDRPLSAGCLITRRCNLRCKFCYGNFEQLPAAHLTAEQWAKVFRHMRDDWGIMRVDLSGGEPTLRKDCCQIAHAAYDAGLNVVLSTNGTLLSEKGLVGFPEEVGVHVSLDSGFDEAHERSRLLPTLGPSSESFEKTTNFIRRCIDDGFRVRAMTCLGRHNRDGLFALAEHLAKLDVPEWNISHILPAGRAQDRFAGEWSVSPEPVIEQIEFIRAAFPWMVVRYSNRTEQNGYFLLVLPDGTAATQFTDYRDKVPLGRAGELSLEDLQSSRDFNLARHVSRWIAAELEPQPEYAFN